MYRQRWIIEARTADGQLDLTAPQPEQVFGLAAIQGITEDDMAQVIFRRCPEASLQGDQISAWPRLLDPRWVARRKTW